MPYMLCIFHFWSRIKVVNTIFPFAHSEQDRAVSSPLLNDFGDLTSPKIHRLFTYYCQFYWELKYDVSIFIHGFDAS